MKKKFFQCFVVVVSLFIGAVCCYGQSLSFDHGKVEFYGTSLVSDIEAITKKVDVKLDTAFWDLNITIDIKSFEFEYETMQEHFNEQYIESDKYPHAIFVGKITPTNITSTGKMPAEAKGDLTIHGITKPVTLKGSIENKDGYFVIKTKFPIQFADYNIEEPSLLTKSVADEVEVNCIFYLK